MSAFTSTSIVPFLFSSSNSPYSGTYPVIAANKAELAPSRFDLAPQIELTYGVALDSENAVISPKFGTLVSIYGVQL